MKNKAFTLIELIIVVTIIIILAGISLVRYGPVAEKARSAEAYSALAQIASAENVYKLEYTKYAGDLSNSNLVDIPSSNNFTFSVVNTDATSGGYAQATGAAKNYYMCLKSGKQSPTPPNCN